MFVSAEDDVDELHRRVIDITRADAVTLANLDRLTIRSLAGEDALLAMLTGRTGALVPSPLFYELDRRIETEQPALVILDTLADLFPGNENDRAQARHFELLPENRTVT
jgi:RecA-family ATPase